MEGRDIGTIVFPDAELKVFLTANEEERVKRRQDDNHAPGFTSLSNDEIFRQLAERDKRDSTREASPLEPAADAMVVDTSGKSVDEVVIEIMVELRARSGGDLPLGDAH